MQILLEFCPFSPGQSSSRLHQITVKHALWLKKPYKTSRTLTLYTAYDVMLQTVNWYWDFKGVTTRIGKSRGSEKDTIAKEVQRFLSQVKVVQAHYFFIEPYFFLCLFLWKVDVYYRRYYVTIYCIIWKEQIVNFSNVQHNSVLGDSGYAFQLCHEILLC